MSTGAGRRRTGARGGSLANRTLILILLVLVLGMGGAAYTIDRAYTRSAEQALYNRLQGYVVTLIAAIERDDQGRVVLANPLSEPRFFSEGSGLYAQVRRNDGGDVWRSPSARSRQIGYPTGLARNETRFTLHESGPVPLAAFSLGVSWESSPQVDRVYTFSVAEDLSAWRAEIAAFRDLLWGWLSGVAAVLIIVQGLVLRWVFRPLRQVSADLQAIQGGEQGRLEGGYPQEMQPVVDNLNALLDTRQSQLRRSREALADLAHSLKTPLAVLQGSVEGERLHDEDWRMTARQQLERMSQQIEYQLQRAATSGGSVLATPVDIAAIVARLCDALAKVYRDKPVRCDCRVSEGTVFHGEEGDLMELFGNLLDNAFKWCRGRIRVTAAITAATGAQPSCLSVCIEDDGAGIPVAQREALVARGVRGDHSVPGQGIGLALVQEIVTAYHGQLSLGAGELGGAAVRVSLPEPRT